MIFKILTFLTLSFISVYSQNQQSFEQANSLYKQGKFAEALAEYKRIPETSAIVNYNMGNCSFRLNHNGYALLYWRRAERNWGFANGAELLNNIKILKHTVHAQQNKASDKHKNDVFLQRIKDLKIYFDFFIRSTPLIFFQIVFLLLWFFVFIFIRYLFKKKKKSLVAILFTTIAIFGLILVDKYNFEIKHHGIIINKNAKLLSGPGQNYQILSFVPEASEVNIEKEADGFYKIKLNGNIGWINQEFVEKF